MTIKQSFKPLFRKPALLLTPLAAGACLLAATSHSAPVSIDHVLALVDDDIIMASELEQRLTSVSQQNGGINTASQRLREQVLERMILESIQLQMADRAAIRISDNELNDAITRIAAQNKMTLTEFRQAMEAEGVSYTLARDQIRNEMRTSRVQRFQVGERVQITDQDIDHFLKSELGQLASAAEYHLGHILISVPSQASASDIQKAEKKAARLYQRLQQGEDFQSLAINESDGRNALKGGDLGWRKEAQLPGIFASAVPSLSVGGVSEPIKSASGYHLVKLLEKRGGATEMVTQTKVRHILLSPNELRDRERTQAQIHQLHQRLEAGEDFAELAREFSDDPGSGASGGDLGWVNPGDMVPSFNDKMNNTSAGSISLPFESRFGWHILTVEDRRDTDIGAEKQRAQVRQMLSGRRFEEELPIWLRKIRGEAYVEIKDPAFAGLQEQ